MTTTCATLIDPQVNSFLVEHVIRISENVILPKWLFISMIRLFEREGIARGGEERHGKEHGVMVHEDCAREEREEGARPNGDNHHVTMAESAATAGKTPISCRAAQHGRST